MSVWPFIGPTNHCKRSPLRLRRTSGDVKNAGGYVTDMLNQMIFNALHISVLLPRRKVKRFALYY